MRLKIALLALLLLVVAVEAGATWPFNGPNAPTVCAGVVTLGAGGTGTLTDTCLRPGMVCAGNDTTEAQAVSVKGVVSGSVPVVLATATADVVSVVCAEADVGAVATPSVTATTSATISATPTVSTSATPSVSATPSISATPSSTPT